MTINIIVCIDENGTIGYNGKLVYNIKKDMLRFKKITTENEFGLKNFCLMGRNTFEEMKSPLKDRLSVVLTSKKLDSNNKNVIVEKSLERVLNHYLSGVQERELFIIGGQKIFEDTLHYVDNIYLTRVKDDTVGDVSFPMHKMEGLFNLVEDEVEYHEENGLEFTFEKWIRKDIKDLS